jgi:hypothetical protein
MAAEFMGRFYASANNRKLLMRRNKSTFPRVGAADRCGASAQEWSLPRACRHQRTKLQLFQMDRGLDKIARRSANCGNKRLFGLSYH